MIERRIIALICSLSFASSVTCSDNKFENIPDYDLRLEERIMKQGYPAEVHQIITEDGYILAAYRIPYGLKKEEPENKNKSAILIVHGMGGSPHNFIVSGKKRASPYYFADREMDVWLFSSRECETPFEKKHLKLDWNKDFTYWLHSFHELGLYDLAATIDYILNLTGQEKITLIGHSAGGHMFYALMSEKPQYNQKIKLAMSWGSAPILRRMDYPIMLLGVHFGDIGKALVKYFRMSELAPTVFASLKRPLIEICLKKDSIWYEVLKFCFFAIGSHKTIMVSEEFAPIIVSNMPRVSAKQPFHFVDNVYNGTFRQYNYGPKGNLKRYGQIDPPHYNLSAATAPSAFFSAALDGEVTLEDIYESMESLPNTIFLHRIPFYKFNHIDYIFGSKAAELVYEPTFQLIKKIDSGVIFPPIKVPSDYK